MTDGSGTYRLHGSAPEDIAADREDFDTSRFIDESEAIALHALTDSEIRDLWCAGRLVRDCTGFRLIAPPKQKLKLWERVAWFASLSGAAAFLIGLGGVAVVGFGETAVEAIAKLAHVRLGDIAEFISICEILRNSFLFASRLSHFRLAFGGSRRGGDADTPTSHTGHRLGYECLNLLFRRTRSR